MWTCGYCGLLNYKGDADCIACFRSSTITNRDCNRVIHLVFGFIRQAKPLLSISKYHDIPKIVHQLTLNYYDSSDKWDPNRMDNMAIRNDIDIKKTKLDSYCAAGLSRIVDSNKYEWKFRLMNMNNINYFDIGIFKVNSKRKHVEHNWKCKECGYTENLWLNLSDGYVGCGRPGQYGGCGASIVHYNNMGPTHHLVVKLGTITPENTGDVWSYLQEDWQYDIDLKSRLSTLNIDIMEQQRFGMTAEEIELDFDDRRIFGELDEFGYMIDLTDGRIFYGTHVHFDRVLKRTDIICKSGDILEIVLDVDNCKLNFILNGKDCEIDLKISKAPYRVATHIQYDNKAEDDDLIVLALIESGYF